MEQGNLANIKSDGSGDGYGSGYGSGDGDGSGVGSGDGDGSGYGYGDGSGYGYGSGYGSGDGDGSGDGSGDGDGYWIALISTFSQQWSDTEQNRLAELKQRGAVIAFWRSDKNRRPANGGSGTLAKVGLREKIDGPLKICTRRALHATLDPPKWKGSRLWIVALFGDVRQQGDKFGALECEFLGECIL